MNYEALSPFVSHFDVRLFSHCQTSAPGGPCETQGVMRATPEARGDQRGEPPSQQGCCGVQGDSSPGRLKSSMPFTVFSL